MTLEKQKVLKQKNFLDGCFLVLYQANEMTIQVLFFENERVKKAKCFILGYTKKANSEVCRCARQEFNLWMRTFWKNKKLLEDDSDIKTLDFSEML
jgi:hypothetical protein